MKVIVNADLSHSTLNKKLELYTRWFASYALTDLENVFDNNIVWTLIGDKPVLGKESLLKTLNMMKDNRVVQLTINRIVNHGKEAAVDGVMRMEDGSSYGFADFYKFSDIQGKEIKEITSYVVQLKK